MKYAKNVHPLTFLNPPWVQIENPPLGQRGSTPGNTDFEIQRCIPFYGPSCITCSQKQPPVASFAVIQFDYLTRLTCNLLILRSR